jgi:hypothetical protein
LSSILLIHLSSSPWKWGSVGVGLRLRLLQCNSSSPTAQSFFGYVSKAAAHKDGPLTLDRLLDRLKKYLDPDDWEKFSEEQNKLTESLIKNYEPARATVPIRINSSHPYDQFKSKSFLPCMTAYATDADGNWDGPYRMYLLIVYIYIGSEWDSTSFYSG